MPLIKHESLRLLRPYKLRGSGVHESLHTSSDAYLSSVFLTPDLCVGVKL